MLTTQRADIWSLHANGSWAVIPTNCETTKQGLAVMGAGLALQAAQRFPHLPAEYGRRLADPTKSPFAVHDLARLILLPTKHRWQQPSDLALIEAGLEALAAWAARFPQARIALPQLGCGLGGLAWETEVLPLCERWLLGEQFVVVAR